MTDDAVKHARAMLEALNLTTDADPELDETPERFVDLLEAMSRGFDEPAPSVSAFSADLTHADEGPHGQEPVILADLPFYSMCVHHLVPFFGSIDVAYVPDELVTGFGSVGKVIDHFARSPQVQERLVHQIAEHLEDALAPRGLLVRCRARQMCMELRGAEKTGSLISSASRGCLTEGPLRQQVIEDFRAEQGGER